MDPAKALDASIAGWRKTRNPRWALLADVAAAEALRLAPRDAASLKDEKAWRALEKKNDPLDLARLFVGIREQRAGPAAEHVKILSRRDDPRVVMELLAILRAPPWRSLVYRSFVSAALDAFTRAKDPRVKPALEDLAPRYREIIPTSVGDLVSQELTRVLPRFVAVAREPDASIARYEEEFAAALATHKNAGFQAEKAKQSDKQFLEAIYAAPGDDAPRLVFADLLMERGDPRGEFIMLQMQKSPTKEQSARLAEFLGDEKQIVAWAMPLSRGGDVTLRRGFPDEIRFNPKTAKILLGEKAFATITGVEVHKLSAKLAVDFLDHPTLAHVRRVGTFKKEMQKKLTRRTRAWTHVSTFDQFPPRDLLLTWPDVVSLKAQVEEKEALAPDTFRLLPKLEALEIVSDLPLTRAHLEGAPNLKRLDYYTYQPSLSPGLFAPLTRLEDLKISTHKEEIGDAALFAGLPLKKLELGLVNFDPTYLPDILAALPKLEDLTLYVEIHDRTLEDVLEMLEKTSVRTFRNRRSVHFTLSGSHLHVEHMHASFEETFGGLLRSKRITRVTGVRTKWQTLKDLEAVLERFGLALDQ